MFNLLIEAHDWLCDYKTEAWYFDIEDPVQINLLPVFRLGLVYSTIVSIYEHHLQKDKEC